MPYIVCDNKCLVESQPNENLLINSDFKCGIINQKQVTTGSNVNGRLTLHVDMWLVMGINANIRVNEKSITWMAKENKIFILQNIPKISGKYTAYVNIANLTGTAKAYLQKRPSGYNTSVISLKKGENIIQFDCAQEVDSFQISLEANSSIEISQVKLEKGSVFTGMPVWNETEELLKCQRLFEVIANVNVRIILSSMGSISSAFKHNIFKALNGVYKVRKQKKPEVTIGSIQNIGGTAISNTVTTVYCDVDSISQVQFNAQLGNFDLTLKNVVIDANEY